MEMYIATVEVELRRSGDVASDVLVKLKATTPRSAIARAGGPRQRSACQPTRSPKPA